MPVPDDLPGWGGAGRLLGRRAECAALDRMLQAVRAGESRMLVVQGEAGSGKRRFTEGTWRRR